jgi:hypothetical protein
MPSRLQGSYKNNISHACLPEPDSVAILHIQQSLHASRACAPTGFIQRCASTNKGSILHRV